MDAIHLVITAVGVSLQAWVLHLVLKGGVGRFPVLTLYCAVLFFSNVIQCAAVFGLWSWTRETAVYYWVSELVSQVLILLTCLEFLWKAHTGSDRRGWVVARTLLIGCALMLISYICARRPEGRVSMTYLVRNLSFGSLLVCFGLWTALIRTGSRQLLLLCAGLGLPLAGCAMGHAFRELSRSTLPLGNLALVLSYVAGQYVWIRALTPARQPVSAPSSEENWPPFSTVQQG